jgi:hypothetical protein
MATRRRHDDGHETMRMLEEHLPSMAEIIEHTRSNGNGHSHVTRDGRTIKECVAVMLVEEPDGSETVMIVGDAEAEHLSLKGALHDGIYAFAHKGEPGFEVKAPPAT